MKQETQGTGSKKTSPKKKIGLNEHWIGGNLPSATSPFHYLVSSFVPVSFPAPEHMFLYHGLLQLDLNIYREPVIKALIKEQSEDLYRLIKKVHFDGKYYRVKCVHSGEWEYSWELAVRVQFFGKEGFMENEPPEQIKQGNKINLEHR